MSGRFQKRPFAGYTEYRYGHGRPIYVPGKSKPRPLVNKDRHAHLVNKTAEMLGTWKSTKFEHEGACRAGLRQAWCLEGYDWQRSDAAAEKVVADALNKIGAKRPSWEEGQWVYTISPDFCAWCHGPIEVEEQSRGRRFCSVDCAKSAVQHMNRKTSHHYGAVLRSALRLISHDLAEPRPCKYCGTMFKNERKDAQFCSSRCVGFHVAGELAFAYEDRDCVICSATFTPTYRKQVCCTQSCGRKLTLQREAKSLAGECRTCQQCNSEFQPLVKSQVYCGKECQVTASKAKHAPIWNERMKAERASKRPPRPCEWCGEMFTPKMTLAKYCSKRCTGDAHMAANGWTPKLLTRRAFDHFLTVPVNASRPAWLTPERFDAFLEAA